MPKLIRLYIQSVAIGFALAAVFAGVMVWQDVMGLGRLILGSDMGLIALGILVVFNGIVFAGVQFGVRIMMMAGTDDGPRGGLRQHDVRRSDGVVPVRAKAPVPARRKGGSPLV